jgi:hypothetical protein
MRSSSSREHVVANSFTATPPSPEKRLRRLAEPAIGEPGVGLHSGLRDLTLVASDAEHVLDHLLPVARLLADLADEPLGPAARIA